MVTKAMAMVDTAAMVTTTTLLVTMDTVLDMITVSTQRNRFRVDQLHGAHCFNNSKLHSFIVVLK